MELVYTILKTSTGKVFLLIGAQSKSESGSCYFMQWYSKQEIRKREFNPHLFVWIFPAPENKSYIAQRIKALNLHVGT